MNRLKELRENRELSLRETAKAVGLPYTTYISYEKGDRSLNSEILKMFAAHYGVSTDYILGRDVLTISDAIATVPGILPFPKMKKVPLLGDIACGEPILAEENIENYINMPDHIDGTFCLRCKGDSMINARIFDGDIVFIRQQESVEDGEIAAVLIDNEATLKRVYRRENELVLRPENPTCPTFTYSGEALQEVRILGKAVYFLSPVQ